MNTYYILDDILKVLSIIDDIGCDVDFIYNIIY